MNLDDILAEQEYLEHHGILGMKWGVRRYQNPDGSLTTAGRIRYGVSNKYREYKENKKRKVIQSGDIKTVLKNKSKLTDEEFEKAIARVERTRELEALRKKDISEKRAIDNAKTAEKNAAEKAKADAKLSKESMKSAERIAKANAKVSVKQASKADNFDRFMKTVSKIAGYYATYKTVASAINDVTGYELPGIGKKNKSTVPKKGDKDDGNKSGKKQELERAKTDYATYTFNDKYNFNDDKAKWDKYNSLAKTPSNSKQSYNFSAAAGEWFTSNAGKETLSTKMSTVNSSVNNSSSASSVLRNAGISSDALSMKYKDILNADSSKIGVPVKDWSNWKINK